VLWPATVAFRSAACAKLRRACPKQIPLTNAISDIARDVTIQKVKDSSAANFAALNTTARFAMRPALFCQLKISLYALLIDAGEIQHEKATNSASGIQQGPLYTRRPIGLESIELFSSGLRDCI